VHPVHPSFASPLSSCLAIQRVVVGQAQFTATRDDVGLRAVVGIEPAVAVLPDDAPASVRVLTVPVIDLPIVAGRVGLVGVQQVDDGGVVAPGGVEGDEPAAVVTGDGRSLGAPRRREGIREPRDRVVAGA